MLLGTDVPDELCEVAEICSGMSLIRSTIRSCGVYHLHEEENKVVVVFDLLDMKQIPLRFPFLNQSSHKLL